MSKQQRTSLQPQVRQSILAAAAEFELVANVSTEKSLLDERVGQTAEGYCHKKKLPSVGRRRRLVGNFLGQHQSKAAVACVTAS